MRRVCLLTVLLLFLIIQCPAEAAEQYNWVKIKDTYDSKGRLIHSDYVEDNSIQFENNYNTARAVSKGIVFWSDSKITTSLSWDEYRLPNQIAPIVFCIDVTKDTRPTDCTDFRKWGPLKSQTIEIGSSHDLIMDYIWAKIGYKRKRPPGTG